MSDDSSSAGAFPWVSILGVVVLMAIAGWHYVCHARLEANLQGRANDYLQSMQLGVEAKIDVQPITNIVQIRIELPVDEVDSSATILGDAASGFVGAKLGPEIERRLSTAARSSIDLYAMAIPYRVTIEFAAVEDQRMRIVKDVQIELARLGYDIGTPDGVNGPKTSKAIADAQVQLGMPPDGAASTSLLNRLRGAKPPSQDDSQAQDRL